MSNDQDMPKSRVAQRIIRARGDLPVEDHRSSEVPADDGSNAVTYQAAVISEGYPHMDFSLSCSHGKQFSFMYHNIDNMALTKGEFGDYITLAHRGVVATIRGYNLQGIFDAIRRHHLEALYQFDPELYPEPQPGEPAIHFIRVQSITRAPEKSDDDEVFGNPKFERG